jgi:hypothetical protein
MTGSVRGSRFREQRAWQGSVQLGPRMTKEQAMKEMKEPGKALVRARGLRKESTRSTSISHGGDRRRDGTERLRQVDAPPSSRRSRRPLVGSPHQDLRTAPRAGTIRAPPTSPSESPASRRCSASTPTRTASSPTRRHQVSQLATSPTPSSTGTPRLTGLPPRTHNNRY